MSVRGYRRFSLSVLGVVCVLVAAGCVSLPTADDPGLDIEAHLAEAEPPAEIVATVEIRETVDGETVDHTEDVWLRDDGTSRIEAGPADDDSDGYVVVTDGEYRWHHDAETNDTSRIAVDGNAPSFLDGLYTQQERYIEQYEITEGEETTVDDRKTYRVEFDPPANETIERSIGVLVGTTEYRVPLERPEYGADEDVHDRSADRVTVWFDRETLFPVKHAVEGEDVAFETIYHDLEIEPGIDDERFAFDPPATETDADGATDADDGGVDEFVLPTTETYGSVADAEDAVPIDVAEPDPETLPEDVERANITGYEFPDEDRTQVTITYRGDDESVSVTTGDGERLFATGGESVEIGTVTGTIAETEQGTELQWACGELYYSIYVSHAFDDAAERAIAIAESTETDCS